MPLIFAPYAIDLARRVAALRPETILEIACGTGVVTRELAATLPANARLVATDLNPAMIDEARRAGTARPVEWQQADGMALPFDDATFDVVVCQFGVMFFPDKAHAYAEARRALRPGGTFLFNAWDRIEANDFAATVTAALDACFPDDPPRFMPRTPHGYHDPALIRADLRRAGFTRPPDIETLRMPSRASTARDVAIAYCQGTPIRNEIDARPSMTLDDATEAATRALAARHGPGPTEGHVQAHVVTIVA